MRHFTLKRLLLLLSVITMCITNVWGVEATFGSDWNSLFGTSYSGTISGVKANSLTLAGSVNSVSFTATNGTSTNGYVKTSDFRAYNGYTITITAPTNNNITAISSTKGGKTFSSGVSANVGTLSISNNAISWSGSSNSVVLSISGTVSFATITVTYASSDKTSVKYDANGMILKSGSTLPADEKVDAGKVYTVSTTTVAADGFKFIGWNTDKDATNGISIVPAATMVKDATVTLYAIWKQVYAITTNNPANGSIKFSTDGTNWSNTIADQEAGAGVYFKLIPEAGFEISGTPTVSNVPAGGVTNLGEGKYKFTMPASAVIVSATFSCATPTFKTNLTEETIERVQNVGSLTLNVEKNESWATYQWQSSANKTDWVDIAGKTSASYSPSIATIGTTYYRCLLKNGVSPCGTSAPSNVVTLVVNAPSKCETPTFSLATGTYNDPQSVELHCVTEGATIYYTTDGTEPSTSSTEYTGAINVFKTMTIRAIAAKDGIESSEEGTITYTIQYTVTFNMQSHGSQVPDQKVGYEGSVEQPATTSITGWTFGGWFKEGACTNQWNFATDKVTGHTTLYAKWTMTKFDVKFYNNGDIVQTSSIQEGQTIGTLPTLTSSDAKDARSKTFVGWTTDKLTNWQEQAPTPVTSTKVVEGELTLNAVWAKEVGVPSTDYSKISAQSNLETNDYVIGYQYKSNGTHFVMKNAVNGSYTTQIAGVAMSPSNNKFTSPNAMYVWHFEKQQDGSYTIYNASVKKYLSASADVATQEVHLADVGTKFNVINTTINSQNLWQLQLANATDYYLHGYSSGTTYYFKVSDSPATSYNKENYITLLYKNESTLDYTDYITHSSASPLASITLNTTNVKTNYFVGETFTPAGLTATATLDDGITFPIEFDDLDISTPDLSTAGPKTVTVEYTFNGATQSAPYTVNAYSVTINMVYTDKVSTDDVTGNKYTWTPTTGALKFSTQAHYQFNGISELSGATQEGNKPNYTLSDPIADVTLTATWQRLFTLTYNGKGGSTPDAVVDKTKGTPITLSSSSWAGYDFVGWYDNEAYDGTALTSPYTITADATIYAKWSEIMPTDISVSSSDVSLIVDGSDSEKSKKITATVNPSTALNKTFTWSVVDGNDVVSVSSEGIITSLKAGTAKVRVTSSRDENIYMDVSVTVHSLPQIKWLNMDGSTYASTNGTSAGKVGALPTGTPNSCDAETYPYFRGWSATNFGKTTTNPESGFVTVNTAVELDGEYTFYAVCAAGEEKIQTVFTETFDQCAGTGGNDGAWKDNIASGTLTADNTGWTYSYGSGAKECAKFGKSSSGKGSAETPSITMSGDGTIILKAAAWNGSSEGTTLNISATSGTVSPSSVTLKKAEWTEYEITISGVVTATKIKFEANTASNNRFFIDNVVVKAGSISYTTWATQCCTTPNEPLEITNTNLTVKTNGTLQLNTTEGNGNTKEWKSLNGAVATVVNGIVTPVSTGKVTITVSQAAITIEDVDYCEQYAEVEIEVIAANEFGISFTAADGGTTVAKVNDTPTQKATTGTTVTITATPADDYNFTGWTVNAGGVTLADASLATTTFIMGEADVEITPSFAKKQFTITLDAGNGKVDELSVKKLENQDIHSTITLPDAVACNSDEWEFKGWATASVTETTTEPTFVSSTEYEVTDNATLYAVYGQGEAVVVGYTISFIDKNGTRQYATGGVNSNKLLPVNSTASNAKVFQIEHVGDGVATSISYDDNGTTKYIYRASNGDFAGAASVPDGATIKTWVVTSNSITGVENAQRGIAGRNASGTTVAAIKDYDVSSIGTTYAPIIVEAVYGEGGIWNSNPSCTHHYQVTYDGNGATTACEGGKFDAGSYTICTTAPTRAGYEFGGWKSSADNQTYAAGATYDLQADVTFTAVLNPIKIQTITLNKTEASLEYRSDDDKTPTVQLSVASTTPEVVADNSVTWSVTGDAATVDDNGLVTAVKTGTATITATAKDGSGATATCTITVKKTYKLTIADTEGVKDIKVNNSGAKKQYIESGTEIKLSRTVTQGYTFEAWVVKQGETPITITNDKFTMPEAEVSVTAEFGYKQDTYIDDMNNNVIPAESTRGQYTVPTLPNADGTAINGCEQTHLYFVGWIEGELDSGTDAEPANMIYGGEKKSANGKTYHAVWAEDSNNNQ